MATKTNVFGEKAFQLEDYLDVKELKFDKKLGMAYGIVKSGVGKRAVHKGIIGNIVTKFGKDTLEAGYYKFNLDFFENFDLYMGILKTLKDAYDGQVGEFNRALLEANLEKILKLKSELVIAESNIEIINKAFKGRTISDEYKLKIQGYQDKIAEIKAELAELDPENKTTVKAAASKKPATKKATKKATKSDKK